MNRRVEPEGRFNRVVQTTLKSRRVPDISLSSETFTVVSSTMTAKNSLPSVTVKELRTQLTFGKNYR